MLYVRGGQIIMMITVPRSKEKYKQGRSGEEEHRQNNDWER